MKYEDGDGKPRPVPFVGIRFQGCCDCGLVHKHTYEVKDGNIIETVERAERATAMLRRGMVKRGEAMALSESNVYLIARRIVQRKRRKRFTATFEPC